MQLIWDDKANYGLNTLSNAEQRSALFNEIKSWANGGGAWLINAQQVLKTRIGAADLRVTAKRTAPDLVTITNVEAD